MKFLPLFILTCCFTSALSQGRQIDLSINITDPMAGDSFVSPSKKIITVYLKNNGPDTIIAKDEFYVGFIFSAFHIFPKFLSFEQIVLPGDSFKYQRELDINYLGDVASMQFCAEAFAYSIGRDSIRRETGAGAKNNKHCVTTSHIDSAKTSSILLLKHPLVTIFPNPSSSVVTIKSKDIINTIIVKDRNGHSVLRYESVNELNTTVALDELIPGMYFISIYTQNHVYTEKLIRIP